MCTYIYDNRTKVLELCNHKSAIRGQSYTRTIRKNTAAQTKVTPPIYSYRMNPFTKQQEQYILIPGRNDYIPGTSNFKTIICTPMTPFSQINGEQLPKNEFCI